MSEINSVSLGCRDLRHQWEKTGDNVIIEERKQVRMFSRRAVCLRCETARVEEFKIAYGPNGRITAVGLIRRRYEYVPGYQVKGGLKVADARAMLFEGLEFVRKDD